MAITDDVCGKRPFWTGKRRDEWVECMNNRSEIKQLSTELSVLDNTLSPKNTFYLKVGGGVLLATLIMIYIFRK